MGDGMSARELDYVDFCYVPQHGDQAGRGEAAGLADGAMIF